MLTRRAALQRGTTPLRRGKPLRWKPRTVPYGGRSEAFPEVGDFQSFIRERDGNRCQACGSMWCGPTDVAHLLFKVGMGGRKKVSVNQPWNACVLGRDCHEEQEHSKFLTAHLVRRVVGRHGYSLPEYALVQMERYAAAVIRNVQEAEEWPNGFDPELSPTG